MIRRTLIGLLAAALSSSLMLPVMAPSASAVTGIDWPTYQFQNAKGSYNASATAITPSNVNALTQEWRWVPNPPTMTGQPGAQIQASPTVYQGRIYIGSRTGVFYALDETTGAVVWSRFVGFQTGKTCSAQGFSSTATIANDPVTGMPTVYVANFAGTVVALNAADGAVRWSRVVVTPSSQANDYALWGSPAVANGHVYIGTSSACDQPLVRAGVVQLNQATGAIQNEYFTQAAGRIGGSIWSSVAVDPAGGDVYATTGNPNNVNQIDDSYSIVRLDGSTLVREDKWTVPVADQTFDADFGATPVLYTATLGGISTPMVAACNKNGILYALRRNNLAAGPVWQRRIGNASSSFDSCIGGVAWDGERLYQGGPTTTVGGASFPGSIRALNPSTGAVIWERGLPANVIQTPTVNGSGVLGIATYNTTSSTTNFAYLIDADTGAILRTWNTLLNGGVFAQMVFADDFVFIPSTANGMRGMKAPAGTGNVPPVARFTASCSGLVCSFDGGGSTDSDGTVTAWAWDFGDGSTDTGAQVQHPYASAGTRTVTLTVTDDGGAQAQTSQTVSPTSGGGGTAIFSDDFSSGDFAKWTSVTRLTIDNAIGSPAPSARAQVTSQSAFAARDLTSTVSNACLSVDVNLASSGGTAVDLLRLRTAANGPIVKVYAAGDRTLWIRSDASSAQRSSGVQLPTGFHNVELCGTVGASSAWDLFVDGSRVVTDWTANTGTTPIGRIQIGDTAAKTFTLNMDDVVLDQAPPGSSPAFSDDFATGDFSKWSGVTGMTIDTTDGVPSAPSALANPSGAAAFAYRLLAETPGHVCASARVEVTSAGSGSPTLFRLRTTANGPVIRVYVNASGALAIRSDAGGTQTSSGVAAGSGWHLVELCGTVGTSSTWDLSRDGATIVNAWVANTGSTPIGRLEIGDVTAKTFTIGFDDVRMDSAPG